VNCFDIDEETLFIIKGDGADLYLFVKAISASYKGRWFNAHRFIETITNKIELINHLVS